MGMLYDYLARAVSEKASDIFIVAGAPVSIKKDGRMIALGTEKVFPKETSELIEEIFEFAHRSRAHYDTVGDDDFSLSIPNLSRFRVNVYRQRGSEAAVIRVVQLGIPNWQELRIPEQIMNISEINHGMVLVAGTAGSGKSTTQACIIDRINHTREGHIITLEDPIEYLHRDVKSIVSQREIAIDTNDYLAALRACLRQAPDVILLGEMRDHQAIKTAMTAAETGHLLIATLHTKGAVNTIDRIIDSFPANQQAQIRTQLAAVLNTVVCQQLLPDVNGGRIAAFEVMYMNMAVKSMIREGKTYQINNAISSGSRDGMISMDQSILGLYKNGFITKETAVEYADDPEQMARKI